jgi:glycosyltransferase involved in cell wall biosynthesis
VCEELSLPSKSNADVIISTKDNKIQNPEDILMVFEVKMSIVNNWKFRPQTNQISYIGNLDSHKGNPSLLRSDSMLKAIGKSLNVRISHTLARKIPIVIVGNTPVSRSYIDKISRLKQMGFIQGFWNLGSTPSNITSFNSYQELHEQVSQLLDTNLNFFSSMKSNYELGRVIEAANQAYTYEHKAHKFLELLS